MRCRFTISLWKKEAGEQRNVSTLELFFDLVFVFTITQITHLVEGVRGPSDYGKAFLVLLVIWWIYAGYVWLTSNLDLGRVGARMFLLAGMAGFFVIASQSLVHSAATSSPWVSPTYGW